MHGSDGSRPRYASRQSGLPENLWASHVTAGTVIDLWVDRLDAGGGISALSPPADLYDPAQTLIASGDNDGGCGVSSRCPSECPAMTYTAALGGTYRLVIRDACWEEEGKAGRYRIYLGTSVEGGVQHQEADDEN